MSGGHWRHIGIVCVATCLFVFAAGVAQGSLLTEAIAQGEIDWEAGVIRVKGYGVPPAGMDGPQGRLLAQRAARADAQRNALEVLSGVRVSNTTQVRDFAVASDIINTSVDGLVRGALVESVTCDFADTCVATLVVPLEGQGGLVFALSGTAQQRAFVQEKVSYSVGVATSITITEPAEPLPERDSPADAAVPISGIIIDARGLGARPAMYPLVFDTQGKVIYSPAAMDPDVAGKSTMVAYARSLENARALARVGANPLVVEAASVVNTGNGEPTDLILGAAAAAAVRQADQQSSLFAQAAVAIVID